MNRRFLLVAAAMALIGALTPVTAGAASSVTLTIRNETGYYLIAVHRAVEGDTDWGQNVLGEDMAVRPGKIRETYIPPGYAWVRAVFDVDGTEVEVIEEADFESGGEYVWTITEDMIWDDYDDTYGYYGDGYGDYYDEDWTYGYYDDGYYGDTYGYYDDTYGYYGDY